MDSIDVSNSSQNAFLIWRNAWQECMWRFGRNGVFGPKNAKICFFILKHMEVLSRLKVHSHERLTQEFCQLFYCGCLLFLLGYNLGAVIAKK